MPRTKKERQAYGPLAQWLYTELQKRRLSARTASVEAGLNHAAISKYMAGIMPEPETCVKLANYFDVPELFVLNLAGYRKLTPELNIKLERMKAYIEPLSDQQVEMLIQMAKVLREQVRKEQ